MFKKLPDGGRWSSLQSAPRPPQTSGDSRDNRQPQQAGANNQRSNSVKPTYQPSLPAKVYEQICLPACLSAANSCRAPAVTQPTSTASRPKAPLPAPSAGSCPSRGSCWWPR